MKEIEASKIVDCIGDNCPMPLVKTREAIMKSRKGEVIKVIGTHPESFKEIPMALEALGIKIIEKKMEKDGRWGILFEV
ncbi:sulfurtransferase TusA family protein [Candidatus Aerophobetes bacterium]|nr:sulfurtransferase TusA family protein [Candidatus Aerophobetes bacterium]